MFKKGIAGNTTVKPILNASNYQAPTVYITTAAGRKMKAYIDQCSEELAWLCVVERISPEVFCIEDVMLFDQEVSAVTANICEKALNDFGSMLIQTGRMDLFNKIRGWGHSHVNMAVSPSGTDEDTFKQFYSTCEYFIRLIGNKRGEMRVDLVDCERGLQFDNLDILEWMDEETRQINELLLAYQKKEEEEMKRTTVLAKSEIEACVKKAVSLRQSWGNRSDTTTIRTGWTGWGYDDDLGNDKANPGKPGKEKEEEEEEKIVTLDDLYTIQLCSGNTIEYAPIREVLDVEEILEMASCETSWQLRRDWQEDIRFSGYEHEDWRELLDEVKEYFLDVMYEEEDKDGNGLHQAERTN